MQQRLADSKYTKVVDGEIGLVDGLGPICDVHAHLALTYVGTGKVDLLRDEVAKLYLDPDREFELDTYMNDNFSPEEMKALRSDLGVGSLRDSGMRATHTAPALKRQMNALGITHSVILAIDMPHSDLNTRSYVTVSAEHAELLAGAAVHPLTRNAEALLRKAVAGGARALKMHPAVQMMRPDHPKAMRLYEVCGELGVPVMWHCGPVGIAGVRADERCQLKHYWVPVHELPQTKFILGHSGARQLDMALKLAGMYDNVWLEVASQGTGAIRDILSTADTHRIMNGSDFPFYHQATSVVKLLEATEGDEALRRRVLYENAAALFSL